MILRDIFRLTLLIYLSSVESPSHNRRNAYLFVIYHFISSFSILTILKICLGIGCKISIYGMIFCEKANSITHYYRNLYNGCNYQRFFALVYAFEITIVSRLVSVAYFMYLIHLL